MKKTDPDWKRLIKNVNALDDLVDAVTTPEKNAEEIVQSLRLMMDNAVEFTEFRKAQQNTPSVGTRRTEGSNDRAL